MDWNKNETGFGLIVVVGTPARKLRYIIKRDGY